VIWRGISPAMRYIKIVSQCTRTTVITGHVSLITAAFCAVSPSQHQGGDATLLLPAFVNPEVVKIRALGWKNDFRCCGKTGERMLAISGENARNGAKLYALNAEDGQESVGACSPSLDSAGYNAFGTSSLWTCSPGAADVCSQANDRKHSSVGQRLEFGA
jgi:hypothetical protein